MKPGQKDQLRRALEQRREVLIEEVQSDAERLRATQAADLERADLQRDEGELQEIEAARRRLHDGTYGTCADCGAAIEFERLHAEPAAARCLGCQARHEKTYRR